MTSPSTSGSGGSDELPALEAFLASIERDASFQAALDAPNTDDTTSATPTKPAVYSLATDPELAARVALVKNWVPSDDDILPRAKKPANEPKAAKLSTPKVDMPKVDKSKKKKDDSSGLVEATTLAAATNDTSKKSKGKGLNKPITLPKRAKPGK